MIYVGSAADASRSLWSFGRCDTLGHFIVLALELGIFGGLAIFLQVNGQGDRVGQGLR